MEHVFHEIPDAGFVGGDCDEARDATDGIASKGLREDCGAPIASRAPPPARVKTILSSDDFGVDSSTRRGVDEETMEGETNATAESDYPWCVTWSENGNASRAFWDALHAKEATNDIRDAPDDFESVTALWSDGYSKQVPGILRLARKTEGQRQQAQRQNPQRTVVWCQHASLLLSFTKSDNVVSIDHDNRSSSG